MNSSKKYLTEKQVSELTGMALSSLRNDRTKAGRRRIPYMKIGKSVRYLESDIHAFMESCRVGGTQQG